jgi:hypothetical protein
MIAFRNFLMLSLLLVTGVCVEAADFREVLTLERCLENIRGTLGIDSVTVEGGVITGVHVVPERGANFVVGNGGNAIITATDIAPVVNVVQGTTIGSVLQFQLTFDVFFTNRVNCKNPPTITLAIENEAGTTTNGVSYLNELIFDAGLVTQNGFQLKVFFIVYGPTLTANYTLIAAVLNADANLNFIAQCNKTKKN